MATKLNKNWFQKLFKLPGKMDCHISESHAHKYVSVSGLFGYRNSEKEYIGDLNWTEEAFHLSQDIVDMTEYDLFIIEDNANYLREITSDHGPYTQYEYCEHGIYMQPIPHTHTCGKTTITTYTYIPIPTTDYYWTSNPNHSNLTGLMRDVEYKYYGHRIQLDAKGKRVLKKGHLVDNIFDTVREYPYFKADKFYTLVYSKTYKIEKQKKR